jgi:Ca2+/Na+ antiporter
MGIKKSGDPSKAMFFIVTGIILCVLTLVSMIMNFQVTSLIGFVLPVLYIVGGAMNKKAAAVPAE